MSFRTEPSLMPGRLARPARLLLAGLVVACLACGLGCKLKAAAVGASTAKTPPAAPVAAAPGPAGTVAAPPPAPARRLWLVAVGDIMLDRNVGRRIKANGAESILARVRAQTRAANLAFGNLECPLATTGSHDPHNCVFRADPSAVKVLLDGGFRVVSVANNHSLDAGRQGLMETLDTLDRNHIRYAGANRDREKAWEPAVLQVQGLKVGFVGCTDLSFEHGSQAKFNQDPRRACAAVTAAKKQCDLLFVSVHWGEEYETAPRSWQVSAARALIDAGADCILGHHPHTLQGIGIYKGCPILYSMGNFIFDQREGERMESAIFELWWKEHEGWRIKATPIWIPKERFGPIYPAAARAEMIARRLAKITGALGTPVKLEGSRVTVVIPPKGAAATVAAPRGKP